MQSRAVTISYHNKSHDIDLSSSPPTDAGANADDVMLIRNRVSRIFYGGKFYDYPISLSLKTITNLGFLRTALIGVSYLKAIIRPIKDERNLEQFLVNRFGRQLYETFFRDYTEKVWGTPCDQITAEWGAQRIKGLSISKAVSHALRKVISPITNLSQKSTETSLIEYFLYPKYGPGQMWDCVARQVEAGGGVIHYRHTANGIQLDNSNSVTQVSIVNENGEQTTIECDYCISTMPIRELGRRNNAAFARCAEIHHR